VIFICPRAGKNQTNPGSEDDLPCVPAGYDNVLSVRQQRRSRFYFKVPGSYSCYADTEGSISYSGVPGKISGTPGKIPKGRVKQSGFVQGPGLLHPAFDDGKMFFLSQVPQEISGICVT
jgi:hypothetical protein